MINIFLAFILMALVPEISFAHMSEDELFDLHRTSDADLLNSEYEKSRFLFMGFSYHSNHQHINQLIELLKVRGLDPKLKFIVLERAHDLDKFYETLSQHDLKTTLSLFKFQNFEARYRSLCAGEWAYAIKYLFPLVRELNAKRPKNNPLLVKAIDGFSSTMDEKWPGSHQMKDGTCKASNLFYRGSHLTSFGISSNREQMTADNFQKTVVLKMNSHDKAIVLYNRGHLLESFQVCQPNMGSTSQEWTANMGLISWLGRHLQMNPGFKSKMSLIFIDEENPKEAHGTTFSFNHRQIQRYPMEDWALSLRAFKGLIPEKGIDIFSETSEMRNKFNFGGTLTGTMTLPEMANGMIRNSRAHIDSRTLGGTDYLGESYCPRNVDIKW